MGLLDLNSAEKKLCRHVVHGDKVEFKETDRVIHADVLRHIVLGLHLVEEGSEKWAGQKPASGTPARGVPCPKTGIGIHMKGARIMGPLHLDSAINDEGGPICPLAFEDCTFLEGISGRRSHFSRLSMVSCTFGDPRKIDGKCVPTIDLSGATIIGDLELTGIKPLARRKAGHLWIRAIGARIGGTLDLSRAHLRAPADNPNRPEGEPRIQPLDVSLANIEGDFFLVHGEVEGMISARGAHIRGDVWMSGTAIRCRPEDKRALFFQLATIGGAMMLDGRWEIADQTIGSSNPDNRFRSFSADGPLNLFGVSVGRSIVMNNARIDSAEETCLDLTSARVGDRIEIGCENKEEAAFFKGRIRLDRVTVGSFLLFEDVQLGREVSPKSQGHCIDARSLVAKQLILVKVTPWFGESAGPKWDLSITLAEATLEKLRVEKSRICGILSASPLRCTGDVILAGTIDNKVDLENARIGGTLDISALHIEGDEAELSLADATIGGVLRLVPRDRTSKAAFKLDGIADLTGLSVDTLDDDIGRRWGKRVTIRMDHFTYRRTAGNEDDEFKQSSVRIVTDWLRARFAETIWPARWFPKRARSDGFWRPWQLRRNWIYQQFDTFETRLAAAAPYISITRHRIREHRYSPQPFEQAIRVARAEGREDYAAHFEIWKQRIEWRFANRGVRWPLGFVAITLSSLWLIFHAHSIRDAGLTGAALVMTLGLMLFGSPIREKIRDWAVLPIQLLGEIWPWVLTLELVILLLCLSQGGIAAWLFGFLAISIALIAAATFGSWMGVWLYKPGEGSVPFDEAEALRVREMSSKVLTWIVYWIPAVLLFAWTEWHVKPFGYFVSTAIFIAIRLTAVVAHMIMRFGFGYMRRPVSAVITLIVAFLAGWGGVVLAKQRDMFVIAAEPIAGLVATVDSGNVVTNGAQAEPPQPVDRELAEDHEPAEGHDPEHLLAGSEGAAGRQFVRDVSCAHEISEPLYALDVLIPIVDLGEERRCEIRRFARRDHDPVSPSDKTFRQLTAEIPDLPLDDHRFWWWMKAIYAVFGWILVSLSILTFAQVNRTHAEPPDEHR